MKKMILWMGMIMFAFSPMASASEVIEETTAKVMVREHPQTGKPFVVITSPEKMNRDFFRGSGKKTKRPDYRLLDPKIKSGQIPYDGPHSDRKKVYILAAALATVGTVGGTAIIAAAPAATGAAAGGAGAYAGAGAGIAAGTLGGSIAASKSDPEQINYTHTSKSQSLDQTKA